MLTAEEEDILAVGNDVEPVKAFLVSALQGKARGDVYNYNQIVQQVRVRDDQELLASIFIGLCSCVSQFTQRY